MIFAWLICSFLTLLIYVFCVIIDALKKKKVPFLTACLRVIKGSTPSMWFALLCLGPIGFFFAGIMMLMVWADD